ncbi:cytochrome P450 [Mycena leptocephala]|nr:cytochrome P450 [Mycena leptocephala]
MAILLAVAAVALCAAILLRRVGTREHGLPPGPPTVPILGNLHIFPTEFPHHNIKHNSFSQLKVGPSTVIVLTDAAAVTELMERRGASTADRPPLHVADRTTGGSHMALAHYTQTYRTLRKTAATILTPHAAARHLPIQRAEATHLLYDILRSPQSFYINIQRYSTSVILSVLYGKRAPRYQTSELTAVFHVMNKWSQLVEPGATPPVDAIPLLKFVPERWSKWKRDCRRIRTQQRALYFGLLDETKERLRRGEENGSYMEEVLARKEELGMDNEMAGYFGCALMEGGSETTSSYLQSLVLALKAHEEIDRVVGEHRIPTLEDLEHMPYIRAVISEVNPLALPHATLATEEGASSTTQVRPHSFTFCVVNFAERYDDPDNFVPERYLLTENGTKPGVDGSGLKPTLVVGFGRRICPGIHLAQNSINLNAMNLLWGFDFNSDIDVDGKVVPADTFAYKKGFLAGPLPFKCRITPRTTEKAKIIEHEFLEAADTFSKFEVRLSAEDKEFVAKSRAWAIKQLEGSV